MADEEEERKKSKPFFRSPFRRNKVLTPPSSTDSEIARRLDNAPSPGSPQPQPQPQPTPCDTPAANGILSQASAYLSGKVG